MATLILDYQIDKIPQELTIKEGYDKLFILLRYKDLPLNKVSLNINNRTIKLREEVNKNIIEDPNWELWANYLECKYFYDEITDFRNLQPATVAICTRDRTEHLKKCIDKLVNYVSDEDEIIVVDNCPSNEDTYNLIKNYKKIRYIKENIPGLSPARKNSPPKANCWCTGPRSHCLRRFW